MKNQSPNPKTVITLIIILLSLAEFTTPAMAQSYKRSKYAYQRSSRTVLGMEGGLGTRSFNVKSDIDGLNNMKASQEGFETFLVFGGNGVRVRSGFGSFKTSMNELQTIKQSSFTGLTNIYALDIIGKTNKYFHPYLITGFDVNIFEFSGSFIPAVPLILSNPAAPKCTCLVPLPADPTPPAPAPQVTSAKMTSTQLVGGVGAEASVRKDGYFFSMFGEIRYGLPVGVTTQNPALNNTEIRNNVAVTFGVGFGLSK